MLLQARFLILNDVDVTSILLLDYWRPIWIKVDEMTLFERKTVAIVISRSVLVTILGDGLLEKLTLHVGEKVRVSARNDSTLWRMTPHCGE